MDSPTATGQARAIALEAASRIVAENLPRFVNLGDLERNKEHTRLVTIDLAEGFKNYILEGVPG